MLETLISWCLKAIAECFEGVIKSFMEVMNFDMEQFVMYFPMASQLYPIIRGIALGLVIGIGIYAMFTFFFGPLAKASDTPAIALVRVFLAVGLVFMGNYILEIIIDVFQGPYSAILAVEASAGDSTGFIESFKGHTLWISLGIVENIPAALLLSTVLLLVLGINMIKLMIELVQRYLMVGVLFFTAPLGWCTVASSATTGILKRWINMFLSQCIMMLISAWSVQMFLSILVTVNADTNPLYKVILAIAFCRIAQKFDSYIQQLGLNPAVTTSNLLDELFAAGRMVGGRKNPVPGGSTKAPLGAATGSGTGYWNSSLLNGGLIGSATAAIRGNREGKRAAMAAGLSKEEAAQQGKQQAKLNFQDYWHHSYKNPKSLENQVNQAINGAQNGDYTAFDNLPQASQNYAKQQAKERGITFDRDVEASMRQRDRVREEIDANPDTVAKKTAQMEADMRQRRDITRKLDAEDAPGKAAQMKADMRQRREVTRELDEEERTERERDPYSLPSHIGGGFAETNSSVLALNNDAAEAGFNVMNDGDGDYIKSANGDDITASFVTAQLNTPVEDGKPSVMDSHGEHINSTLRHLNDGNSAIRVPAEAAPEDYQSSVWASQTMATNIGASHDWDQKTNQLVSDMSATMNAMSHSADSAWEGTVPEHKISPVDEKGLRWNHNKDHGAYSTEFRFDHKDGDTTSAWKVGIMNQPEIDRLRDNPKTRDTVDKYREFKDNSGSSFYISMQPINDTPNGKKK